ncbi:heme peroxidase domain-containing protein [Ditylenchus destructor]|nr:heme peroxidase domain-containing protein [Ditylenchus destructor]
MKNRSIPAATRLADIAGGQQTDAFVSVPIQPDLRPRDGVAVREIDDAINEIDKLYNDTEDSLLSQINILDHMMQTQKFWASHTRSDRIARERAFGALVALSATKRLRRRHLENAQYDDDLMRMIRAVCVSDREGHSGSGMKCDNSAYRQIDGHCNNVEHTEWGATYSPFQRFLAADYADGISEPRRSAFLINGKTKAPLPNPRVLSNLLFREPAETMSEVVAITSYWAFFIYTDLVHIGSAQLFADSKQLALPCCSEAGKTHPECMPISLLPEDNRFRGFSSCMEYSRTVVAPRAPECALGSREQANIATSFLDGSTIYGSTEDRTKRLRSFHNGRLLTSHEAPNSRELPPTMDLFDKLASAQTDCTNGVLSSCFISGTDHTNFLPTLTALHTIWIRQHNRIAKELLMLNKKWTDEQLFQETRRIVIAQMQHITYHEYLPMVLGLETWMKYGLNSNTGSAGTASTDVYDLEVNPSTLNVFSLMGQFFFTMFDGHLAQYGSDGFRIMDRPLSEYFNDPSSLFFNDKIDGIMRYLIRQNVHQPGLHMTSELKDKLFKNNANLGLDLAALILQMGRDHGIAGYTVWREKCGGTPVNSFDDLESIVADPKRILPILSRHFKYVEDVDLFLLGLAEKPLKGSLVGPTLGCILAMQFQKVKRGDRYWYENALNPWAFSSAQLAEIRKSTLAHVICANTDLTLIQPSVFEAANSHDVLPSPNIDAWSDVEPQIQMPVTMNTIKKAIQLGLANANERLKRESKNIAKNQGTFQPGDPLLTYAKMMRPKREAVHVGRMSHVLLEATKLIMRADPLVMGNEIGKPDRFQIDMYALQQALPQIDVTSFLGNIEPFLGEGGTIEHCLPRDQPCDHTTPYRTFTGWCNNLRFPHYGNAFGPLRHLLPPVYDDGIDTPRSRAKSGAPLPSPRIISNAMHIDLPIDHEKFTLMVMQFGQILDHELTHSPVERGPDDEILNCTRCDSPKTLSEHCMPLPVPEGDPHFPTHDDKGERRCLPFARSILGQLSLGYRNQLNQLTAFIDGSAIYGSTQCEAATLRLFEGGRLNFTNLGDVNPEALPQGDQEQDCRSKPRFPCFVAGDERNSHQPGLTTMHNIFLREHNRIARQLEIMNPLWDDEKIYQETRRIVGAIFQHIVNKEYLPKLIGKTEVDRNGLTPLESGYFTGYDPNCDASISHPFATAAFRFGHTLIRRFFPRLNTLYHNFTKPVDLVDNYNNVEAVYDDQAGGIDTILVGLLGTPSMAFDRFITNAVRNHLFAIRNAPLSGLDLISLNILRARDHGVQPYNSFRELCGLPRANTFADLADQMDQTSIEALQRIYEHVDDIDIFPGLFSERPMGGALMPHTMACIIAEQFTRLKKCDRFYYENDVPETRFTPEQLAEIRKITLGSVLCQNSKILTKIQPDVFSMPDNLKNAQIPCADFPRINLARWMERPMCFIGNDQVPRGSTKLKSPCVKCTCTADGPRCKAMKILNCKNLLDNFLLIDIKADLSCVVQCSPFINQRLGKL